MKNRRRLLLDMERHSGFVMSWVDADGVILEQVGSGLSHIAPPPGADSWVGQTVIDDVLVILTEAIKHDKRIDYTIDWPAPNGDLHPWSVSLMPTYDGAGQPNGGIFAAVARDDERRPHARRRPPDP